MGDPRAHGRETSLQDGGDYFLHKVGADFGGVGVDSPHGRAPPQSRGVHNYLEN